MICTKVIFLLFLVALAAVRTHGGQSSGIVFVDQPRSRPRFGTSSSAVDANVTLNSTGDGRQKADVDVSGSAKQEHGGPGGSRQEIDNNVDVHVNQAQGNGKGGRGGAQGTDVNVNIENKQVQNNINGTVIQINRDHKGVVNVFTIGKEGQVLNKTSVNNKPIANRTIESSNCKYVCKRRELFYCCDDGTNPYTDRKPEIHGGNCPTVRPLCNRNSLIHECAHDGQCAPSDRCCFDACVDRHICKQAVE